MGCVFIAMKGTWVTLFALLCMEFTSGYTNVARSKPAWQSSNHTPWKYLAANGNDGNTSTFIHTQPGLWFSYPAWWVVDLEREVQDATVTVYFRIGGSDQTAATEGFSPPRRITGVQLFTSSTNFTRHPSGVSCTTFNNQTLLVTNVTCAGSWRYLKVYSTRIQVRQDNGAVIDFREVQVWGCTLGMYGADCNIQCGNCYNATTIRDCHQATGECLDGCQHGWKGPQCTQACENDVTYGRSCAKACSNRHCLNTLASCDVQTGSCGVERCQAGWKGNECLEACVSGATYGHNCAKDCSNRHCLNTSASCDVQIGSCGVDKCQAGWNGNDCIESCSSGIMYGRNCEGTCSNRHCLNTSASCDVQTGSCGVEGCQAGWNGTDCTQSECILGERYGLNCKMSCSNRHCLNTSVTCDVQTGSCGVDRCQSGWMGQDCTQECTNTYGFNCENKCVDRHCMDPNGDCDPWHGTCTDGCQENWSGVACSESEDLFQSPSSSIGSGGWAAVGGVIGAVITLIIITGVIVCLIRRGRLKWMKQPGSGKAKSSTEMSSVVRDADQSQSSSRHVYNNDYDVMNSDAMAGDKMYDVIKNKHYENI